MRRVGEPALVALLLTVTVGCAVVSALHLGPAARRMPLVVGLPTLALLVAELIRAWQVPAERSPGVGSRERAMAVWLAALVGATLVAGVIAGPPLVLAAYLRLQARERWTMAFAFAGVLGAIVFVVFDLVLQLPAGGILGEWPR